ncbi:MAG: hypothetical protein ACTSYT_01605, partial [Candidatus Asgardarchaeia archaeon]
IKCIRGLYSHIRRRLQEKNRIGKIKKLGRRERRKVNQQLHIIANEIVAYAKQFPKPVSHGRPKLDTQKIQNVEEA